MVKRYVYLFELDSARTTDLQVARAWDTLYEEIVKNNNVVILTFNQIADSRLFISLLTNSLYRDEVLQLFRNGAIKISQYDTIRTPVQYLINSIDREDLAIYLSLPVKSTQKHLLALLRRALVNSDVSELREYLYAALTASGALHTDRRFSLSERWTSYAVRKGILENTDQKKDIRDLFQFRTETEVRELFRESGRTLTTPDLGQISAVLKILYYWLDALIEISLMDQVYSPCRSVTSGGQEHLTLPQMIQLVSKFSLADGDFCKDLWEHGLKLITRLNSFKSQNNSRSEYNAELLRDFKSSGAPETERTYYEFAQAIVNLCYNFSCELSIYNVSRHYRLSDLNNPGQDSSFRQDFMNRLRLDWETDNRGGRYLREDTDLFEAFNFSISRKYIRQLHTAVRFSQYAASRRKRKTATRSVQGYESGLKQYRRRSSRKTWFSLIGRMILVMFLMLLPLTAAVLLDMYQNWLETGDVSILSFRHIVLLLAFLVVAEAVNYILERWSPSLQDSFGQLRHLLVDAVRLMLPKRHHNYTNEIMVGEQWSETADKASPVRQGKSRALKEYMDMQDDASNKALFTDPDPNAFPLADLSNAETVRQLIRQEEDENIHYGVVYRSRYNTLLVDPIREGSGFFPYERVIPSSGKDGVVILVKCRKKFVLLRQFRHAIRSEQLACPRGFTEENQTPEQAAKAEVEQELGAVANEDPDELGRLAVDSGLTSNRLHVYLVKIDKYKGNIGHEGILGYKEVSESELSRMIANGEIDDAPTIGAFALYQAKNASAISSTQGNMQKGEGPC